MAENNLQDELLMLRETNRILQDVTRNMVDAIVITDTSGIITYSSESVIQLGYNTHDLIGKNVFELVHHEDVPVAMNEFASMVKDACRKEIEFRMRGVNGDYYWYDVIGQLLKEDTNSGTKQYIFSGRNIHDRKQAEAAFRQSEQTTGTFLTTLLKGCSGQPLMGM
ncbi:MAG: PAS domain-containing protein [Bacteroidales bacterium]